MNEGGGKERRRETMRRKERWKDNRKKA